MKITKAHIGKRVLIASIRRGLFGKREISSDAYEYFIREVSSTGEYVKFDYGWRKASDYELVDILPDLGA